MDKQILYKRGEVVVREAIPADIIHMKDRLCKEVVDEIWAASASTPEQSLTRSFLASVKCYTILLAGVPAAMFGIAPDTLLGERACLWLLSTNLVAKMKRSFMEICKKYIGILLDDYPYLYNLVDFRYKQSLEWLQWLGAKISDPKPFGPEQLLFCRIEIRR